VADVEPISLTETDVAVAWNVRGDPARRSFVDAVDTVLGVPLPMRPNTSSRRDGAALLWLGPRSWLLVAGRQSAQPDFDAARKAINAASGALFDVSSGHAAWTISGSAAARVLNRGCPLDLHPAAFRAGSCAQSVLGHVNALIYRPDERAAFLVMVARSFAKDARDQLGEYARTEG
jgi:sarcosine oxidase subunit gamma